MILRFISRPLHIGLLLLLLAAGTLFLSGRTAPLSRAPISIAEASRLPRPHVRSSFSRDQGEDVQARYEYELMRLRDPATGQIPPDIRARELAFASRLPRVEQTARKTGSVQAGTWSFRGPNNVGGRTRALGIDLDYNGGTNRRILAGGISGGIYLSEDDGQTWTLKTSRSDFASVSSLVQNPANRNVWYFGSGEFSGNSAGGGLQQYYGNGIFKSMDGGNTWSHLPGTREGSQTTFDNFFDYIWNLAIPPNGSAVFAATFAGIHRSTDGGNTWQFVLGSPSQPFNAITDVTVATDGDVYATLSRNGGGGATYGVFKSTGNGAEGSWQNISPPGLTSDPYRMVVGAAPSDANTLYLLVQINQSGAVATDHQLFRYNDATGTWTDLSASLPNEQGVEGNASFSTQGGYDQIVRVKPDDPNVVFIGGTNLYRSTDGGNTFTRIGGYAAAANYATFSNHHSDQHSLSFYPNDPNAAISGSDGGLSKTTNILAQPHSWAFINEGYVTTQFYSVAIDPQAGGTWVMGGLQDNGVWATDNSDPKVAWSDFFGGDGAFTAVTPGATALYVSSQNGNVFRVTNQGYSAVAPAGGQQFMFITPFRLDPNDPRVMYMADAGGVWRNSNLDGIPEGNQQPIATNWTFLNTSALTGLRTSTLTLAKTPANRLYFGATDYQSQTRLVRVDNAQNNGAGTTITPPVTSQGFPPFPSSIAVNPDNGDEIIATFSNYQIQSIWYSSNAGGSWTNIDGNLGGDNGPSVRSAVILPAAGGKLYFVGTSTGVYSTTTLNGSNTVWSHEGGDVIGNVVVDMLIARPEDGVIVAGTHGRGVYQATVSGGGAAAVATVDANQLEIELQPGASASTTFTLTNTGTAALTFNLSASGKREAAAKVRLTPDATLRRPSEQGGTARPPTDPPTALGLRPGSPTASHLPASGDFLVFDDGNVAPDDFFGWGDGFTPFQWGNSFTAPVGGFQLESVFVYMRTEFAGSNLLQVYITDPAGNTFLSGTVNLQVSTDGMWYEITFDPIVLSQGQPFDIEFVADGSIFYPAGLDYVGLVPGKSFYWFPSGFGGFYVNLSNEAGFENSAWLIRAQGTAGGTTVNQPPQAVIKTSKTQAFVNEAITFDATGSSDPDGTITQVAWNFGDGTTGNQAVIQHAYTQTGTYTVTLTVTDNQGASTPASTQITVGVNNKAPTAAIQVSAIQALVNETISFDASGSTDDDGTITQYAWAFGDGTTSNQPATTHAYTSAGAFTATLTVTDNLNGTGQASIQINILDQPSRLMVTPLNGTLAPGASQTITVTYNAEGLTPGSYDGEVTMTSNGGSINLPVVVTVGTSVDVALAPDLPADFALDQNYPNPFNPVTTIPFTLKAPRQVRLTVFDVSGRAVRTLLDEHRPAGVYTAQWNGRDAEGRPVASGLYFYRLDVYDAGRVALQHSRKMLLLK